MAYLKTAEEHLNDINGVSEDAQDPLRSGIESTQSTPGGGEVPTQGPNNTATQTQPPSATSPSLFQDSSQGYFNPLSQARSKIQGQIGRAKESFYGEAGPSRSFESIGGKDILRAGIDTSGDVTKDRQEIEAAQGLFGAKYRGPKNLSEESIANIQKQISPYLERGRALGTLRGTATIAQERAPGLTRGESLFEARALREDPEFRAQAMASENQANALDQEFQLAQRRAAAFANQRTQEEAAIADQTGQFLRGERSSISDQIAAEVAKRNAERDSVLAAYEKILGSSDPVKELMGTDHRALGFNPNAFDTEARRTTAEGQKVRDEILARYDRIKDVPLMELGINSHGRQALRLPDEWFNAAQGKYSPDELQAIKNLAMERQQALESAGFSPDVIGTQHGKYGELLPLYYGVGDFAPEDVRPYLDLDPGMVADRNNTANLIQKNAVNNINEIMGEVDRIAEADPYRAAQIMADTETFLNNEQAALDARRGGLSESAQEYAHQVSRARKRYKKMKKIAKYAKIARISNHIVANTLLPGVGSALYEGERKQGSTGDGSSGGDKSTAGKTEQNEGKLAYSIFG